jgi:hypothetical protein
VVRIGHSELIQALTGWLTGERYADCINIRRYFNCKDDNFKTDSACRHRGRTRPRDTIDVTCRTSLISQILSAAAKAAIAQMPMCCKAGAGQKQVHAGYPRTFLYHNSLTPKLC